MTSEPILDFINEKTRNNGYNSVIFDLALIKEDGSWKILLSRIIFDVSESSKPITFLKDDNFVIERVSISINQFNEFFNYLMQLGARTSPGFSKLTDDFLYVIGNYKLCFLGNFLPNRYNFHGRERAMRLYGIDKPVYRIEYSLQNSVVPHSDQSIDVSGYEAPFRSVFDAVNYYWHTNWEQHHLPSVSCGIFLPIFDASIKNVTFDGIKNLNVELNIPTNSNKINELSVGINTSHEGQQFIQRFPVKGNLVSITMPFPPTFATIYLHKNKEKLDEYYWGLTESTANKNGLASNLSEDSDKRLKHLDIFLSHSNMQKELAGKLKRGIEDVIKCDVFLAHDDLEGGEIWAEGLRERIKNCDYFLVLLSEEYHDSDYTDQETGIAYAYDRLMIPISIDGTIPYGFMNKYQPIKVSKLDKNAIREIAKQIISKDIPINERIDHYIQLLKNAYSFNNAIFLSELLPYDNEYSKEQINKLASIMIENDQVHGSMIARPQIAFILNKNASLIDNELRNKLSDFLK